MLEIIVLVVYGQKVAALARSKGRSGGWAALGICLWIGGELFGAVVGTALGLGLGAYLAALICAVAGAVTGYVVVASLGPPPGWDESALLVNSGETAGARACPKCESVQTELTGGYVVCHACDAITPV